MSRRAKGEGSTYFDKARGVYVRQDWIDSPTGKNRKKTAVGKPGESRASVSKRGAAKKAELEATSPGAPETLDDLLDVYVKRVAPRTKSESSMAVVRSLVANHISPALGSRRLNTITVEHLEAFFDAGVEKGLSRGTLVKIRAILSQSMDVAVKRRHMTWNPSRAAELPPEASHTREPRALSASEARSLLNVAAHHRSGAFVTVGVTLGLRPGEIAGLTWEALDLDAARVTVYQALGKSGGRPILKQTKSGNTRTLAMPPITVDALRDHRKRTIEERLLMGDRWPAEWSSLVFVTERGNPLDSANTRRLVRKLAAEAGIEGVVTPYDMRHSATTLIAASGLSADRLADMLGHRDTRMVWNHYRHREGMVVDTAVEYWTETG
jgi:integrase